MTSRKDRLKKLVKVQEQLKAVHETRHAGFVAAASSAGTEARELAESFDAEGSLSILFPELYNQRIAKALTRKDASLESARAEAAKIATATARTNLVERAYREVRRMDERDAADRDRLELIQRKLPKPR